MASRKSKRAAPCAQSLNENRPSLGARLASLGRPAAPTTPDLSMLPERQIIQARLEDAILRVCRVIDILTLSREALNDIDLPDDRPASAVWGALQAAEEVLGRVMEELDGPTFLKTEVRS